MNLNHQLGKALRKHRELQELSQFQLAAKAKITQSYYCAVENGQHRISFAKLLQIMEVLGFESDKVIDRMFSEI